MKLPDSPTRRFVKTRLEAGDSARTIRQTYNHIAAQPPSYFKSEEWGRWHGLSGAEPITAKEIHRIQSATSRKVRDERRENRASMRVHTESDFKTADYLGLPEPTVDYQEAHDAGMLYRATKDERYREIFTEGSDL